VSSAGTELWKWRSWWKLWKAKGGLPTSSHSSLGISPKAGEIPTFPQPRRRGHICPNGGKPEEEMRAVEKWKSKTRIPTFPPPRSACGARKKIISKNNQSKNRLHKTLDTAGPQFPASGLCGPTRRRIPVPRRSGYALPPPGEQKEIRRLSRQGRIIVVDREK
jgi:hypothetical protein